MYRKNYINLLNKLFKQDQLFTVMDKKKYKLVYEGIKYIVLLRTTTIEGPSCSILIQLMIKIIGIW